MCVKILGLLDVAHPQYACKAATNLFFSLSLFFILFHSIFFLKEEQYNLRHQRQQY